jgi:hypothetical protein
VEPLIVPEYEINVLLLAEVEAMDLADQDKIMDGYNCLVAGLRRAEETRAFREPWAGELVKLWQKTLDSYCRRYGAQFVE